MSEIEKRGVSPELLAYLAQQQGARATDGSVVHLHYHAAPEPVNRPATASPAPNVLERYTPYLVLGVFALFGVAAVCAVLVIAGPIIVAVLGSVVAIVIAAAGAVLAVGAAALFVGNAAERVRGQKSEAKAPKTS